MLKIARVLTEVLSPTVLVTLFLVMTGGMQDGVRGLWFGLLAAAFTALGPFAGILVAQRLGKLTDHHVSDRKQRLPVLVVSLVSAIAGFIVLLLTDAPRPTVVGILAVALGMIVLGAVNAFWKLSVHTAVVTFVALASVISLGAGALPVLVVPAAVGWSRVKLGDHTVAQVLAGVPSGAIVSLAYAASI